MVDSLRRVAFFVSILVVLGGCAAPPFQSPTISGQIVPQDGVVELAIRCGEAFSNPFSDVTLAATFHSPSGEKLNVDGFYSGGDEWRVRFVPREVGQWRYETRFVGTRDPAPSTGAFHCPRLTGHGFLRVSKKNHFRYEYDDGTPFYPIGIQTTRFFEPDFDGPTPEGKQRTTDAANWLKEFRGAVSLVRTQFGQGTRIGAALPLVPLNGDGTRYDLDLARKIDHIYQLHRAAGMSQILIFFQDMSLWGPGKPHAFSTTGGRDLENFKSLNAANLKLQEQYIRYIVARYGCYIDIWEIFNEDSFAPPEYLEHMAGVIRKADPYRHLVTTNYARPSAAWCDITTYHEYTGCPANQVDALVSAQFGLYKSHGKLVQNTEFGNQGKLSNIDPVKWRIAVWTAFMNEGHLLFWGMSGQEWVPKTKGTGNANAYIGADSRQHFRVHNQFVKDLPVDLRPTFAGYTDHSHIRTYALGNDQLAAVYVHHFADHSTAYTLPHKLMIHLTRGTWEVTWIDPATGNEVSTETVDSPQDFVNITVPPVTIDLAARMKKVGKSQIRKAATTNVSPSVLDPGESNLAPPSAR